MKTNDCFGEKLSFDLKFFLDEHGHTRQTFVDDRRDCHIDLFRRFFLFFVARRERDESVLDISLSFVLSYRTTRNHVVISSRENERKTHCYITTTTHEFLDS